MLEEFLWGAFENTGSVDAYIFLKEIEQLNKVAVENKGSNEEAATKE